MYRFPCIRNSMRKYLRWTCRKDHNKEDSDLQNILLESNRVLVLLLCWAVNSILALAQGNCEVLCQVLRHYATILVHNVFYVRTDKNVHFPYYPRSCVSPLNLHPITLYSLHVRSSSPMHIGLIKRW